MDRLSLKMLIEKHWRTIITLYDADKNAAVAEIFAFEERIYMDSEKYSIAESDLFLSTIAQIRNEFASRARADHLALRKELGLNSVGDQRFMDVLANLETSTILDPKMYLHDFWRKAIMLPPGEKYKIESLWSDLCISLNQKLNEFPQYEQDAFFTRLAVLNETYMKNYSINPHLIRNIIGLPEQKNNLDSSSLANTVVKAAIDTSIGQFLSLIFGIFRR